MNRRRTSISALMWVVGIVAVNLTVGRMIFWSEPWRLAGIAPIAISVQIGLLFLIRSRGKRRPYAFWAGFEAGSMLGLWSFLYARVPDSRVGAIWENYGAWIDEYLGLHYGLRVLNRSPFDSVLLTVIAVFAFLPQLLLGIAAGLLALSLAWSRRSRVRTFVAFAVVGLLILHTAAWLFYWSILPAQPPWLPSGVTAGGLMLELGFFGLIRGWSSQRSRAFWVGFVALGSLVFLSYMHAMVFTPFPLTRYLMFWPGGPWYAEPSESAPFWMLWIDYTALASYALGRPPYGTNIVAWSNKPIDSLAYALIAGLPHLFFAMLGGLVASRFAAGRFADSADRSRNTPVPTSPAPEADEVGAS